MVGIGRVLGICGAVALLSVPLTLFLWDWRLTWIALAKLTFGLAAIVFWAVTNPNSIRETFQGRSVFHGMFGALFVGLVIFGLVVVNYVVTVHPHRIDLTTERIFSLSEQTLALLDELEGPVEVMAFYGPQEPELEWVASHLERYRYASDKIVFELVDPAVQLDLVERYQVHLNGPRLVLRYRDREERVRLGVREQRGPEEAVTAALSKLIHSSNAQRLCFATGHGEKSLGGGDPRGSLSQWVRDLKSEGYRPAATSLLKLSAVPKDCEAMVVAGPQRDFTQDELESLKRYLQTGGRLMALLGAGETDSLTNLLRGYGIGLGDDAVVFPRGRSPLAVVTDPSRYPRQHPVFSRLVTGGPTALGQLQAVAPLARSVTRSNPPAQLEVTELIHSPADAWAESDPIDRVNRVAFDEGKDRQGPVPLAVVSERKPGTEPSGERGGLRLAVFGSSLIASDAAYRIFPFNRDLIMNTLAWLTREEQKITIRPRFRAASLLRLTESQLKLITFFTSDFLPLCILALGISVWQVRRWS